MMDWSCNFCFDHGCGWCRRNYTNYEEGRGMKTTEIFPITDNKLQVTVRDNDGKQHHLTGVTFLQLIDLQKTISEFVLETMSEAAKKPMESSTWESVFDLGSDHD